MREAEAMEMLTFSSLCDNAAGERHPIPSGQANSGQANGCELLCQRFRPGFSPLLKHFRAFLCHLSCHFSDTIESRP
jgi:hypothetical protein